MASASTLETTERSPLLPPPTPTPLNPPRPQRTVTFNPHTTISHPNGPAETSTLLRAAPASTHAIQNPQQVATPGQPRLSTLNNKLRRRNSHGSPLSVQAMLRAEPKIGPQRTTKNAQKLKLLPNPDPGDDGPDEESGRDVYSQFTRIKDPTARRDAARLGKADRDRLPRVTAYCTANGYRLEGLLKWLKSKKARQRGANPKQFDECIYTPYNYDIPRTKSSNVDPATVQDSSMPHHWERRFSDSAIEVQETNSQRRGDLIDLTTSAGDSSLDTGESSLPSHDLDTLEVSTNHTSALSALDFDTHVHTPEVFLFQYGTIVIWGMTLSQETKFLNEISRFETEKLSPADIQTENFNFYYTREYQARIYNDFISLREKKNYMTKLAISHALAQSVKTSLFEDLLSTTIASTQSLPEQIALTGSIALSRREIHQQIGQLFILRINIHLQGSVLDSPELMWAEPALEPVYAAVRSYLEMDQRVGLLTERLSVIGDLLAVLKDQVGTKHGEYLEWIGMFIRSPQLPPLIIFTSFLLNFFRDVLMLWELQVIVLIAAEILVAAINIVVDLYAGID
ncbi:MAG: hypothetical protein Q9217_000670 [Psora testacea]